MTSLKSVHRNERFLYTIGSYKEKFANINFYNKRLYVQYILYMYLDTFIFQQQNSGTGFISFGEVDHFQ